MIRRHKPDLLFFETIPGTGALSSKTNIIISFHRPNHPGLITLYKCSEQDGDFIFVAPATTYSVYDGTRTRNPSVINQVL